MGRCRHVCRGELHAKEIEMSSATKSRCSQCEQERVHQYDLELRLAGEQMAAWKAMAVRLHSVLGCGRKEKRRLAAELEYLRMIRP